jgi:hypothetical protein
VHIGGRKERSEHRNKNKEIRGRNTIKNSESNKPKSFIVRSNALPANYFNQHGIAVNEPLFR